MAVVAGASGGAPDAVIPGVTGEIVDGTNDNEISSCIVELLSHPQTLKAMGQAGNAWAQAEWSWELWGEKFSALLRP